MSSGKIGFGPRWNGEGIEDRRQKSEIRSQNAEDGTPNCEPRTPNLLRFPDVPLAYSDFVMTDSGEKNSILNGVEIKGTIRFSKELTFDGALEGDVVSQGGTLIVGGSGKIKGNVEANSVVVKGKVTGNIAAASRCE